MPEVEALIEFDGVHFRALHYLVDGEPVCGSAGDTDELLGPHTVDVEEFSPDWCSDCRESDRFVLAHGHRCPECETLHADWSKDGEHAVRGPFHEGIVTRWECGRCGAVEEVGQR